MTLAADLDDDLPTFFDADELADAAIYDGSTPINGIFGDPDSGQLGIAGSNPTFECAASAVAADPTEKTLIVRGITYTIRDIKPGEDARTVILELTRG